MNGPKGRLDDDGGFTLIELHLDQGLPRPQHIEQQLVNDTHAGRLRRLR
jgi:hypothetical protein